VDELSNAQQMEKKYAKGVFPIFYDPEERVAKLLHQEIIYLKFGRMPGLLVVDTKGIIRFAYYSDGMKDIPANDDVFEVLEAIEGKHIVRQPAEKPNEATER
jgi:hypothetical protein